MEEGGERAGVGFKGGDMERAVWQRDKEVLYVVAPWPHITRRPPHPLSIPTLVNPPLSDTPTSLSPLLPPEENPLPARGRSSYKIIQRCLISLYLFTSPGVRGSASIALRLCWIRKLLGR